jgi:exoribonuclease-2
MILANRISAEYCAEHGLAAIYRSQPAPDQELPRENLTPEVVFRMRRFLRKGEVGLDPQRHYGLGLEAYLQATSPIRRYSDLLIQRQMTAHLAGQAVPYQRGDLERLLIDVGRTASQAEQLERERKMYWTLRFLEQRRYQEFDAIVLANFPDKHIIQLQPILFETDCPHVAGRPLTPGTRIRVRIDVVWPRQESVRVTPIFDEEDEP